VDAARGHSHSLSPQQITDFLEKYNRIIEIGLQENPAIEYAHSIVKRGRRKQSKAKNLLDRCQKYRQEILSFMFDFSIPFTNNQAERVRQAKL
jgi:transposase